MWLTRRNLLILAAIAPAGAGAPEAANLQSLRGLEALSSLEALRGLPPGPIALNGFDAVSYFLDAPEPGRAAHEVVWAGRTWRFARAGNREAFRRDPARYAPRLGGFDPIGILAGRLVDSDPAIFARVPDRDGLDRLYLMRNAAHRDRVVTDPGLVDEAEARWPTLRGQIEGAFPD